MSNISYVSLVSISSENSLPLDDSISAEIIQIKPIDYLFQSTSSLRSDLNNLDKTLNMLRFLDSSDSSMYPNIQVSINPSDDYSYLQNVTSINSIIKLIIEHQLQIDYEIYIDNIQDEMIANTMSSFADTNLYSYIENSLLAIYKFNIQHPSTDFLSTFTNYTTSYQNNQPNFNITFGIIYHIVEYNEPEPEPEPESEPEPEPEPQPEPEPEPELSRAGTRTRAPAGARTRTGTGTRTRARTRNSTRAGAGTRTRTRTRNASRT